MFTPLLSPSTQSHRGLVRIRQIWRQRLSRKYSMCLLLHPYFKFVILSLFFGVCQEPWQQGADDMIQIDADGLEAALTLDFTNGPELH